MITDRPRRSLLFTPANRASAFDKALLSGADIVCLDLEDAVPPNQKDAARSDAIAFLAADKDASVQRAVRINAVSSRAGIDDLAALLDAAPQTGLVMLPKVNEAAELRLVASLLSEVGSSLELAALVETLDGLENVSEIAQSTPRMSLMVFGAVDFSAELGTENAQVPLQFARSKLIHAAKRAKLDAMDVPSLNFRDLDELRAATHTAKTQGFTGKAAIHPLGIDIINDTFTPSAEEIAYAQRVIAAFEASPNGLAILDGSLVEAPVVKAMQRKLAIARTCAGAPDTTGE